MVNLCELLHLLLLFTVFCLRIQFYLVFCAKLFENSALRILNFLSTALKTIYLCHEDTFTQLTCFYLIELTPQIQLKFHQDNSLEDIQSYGSTHFTMVSKLLFYSMNKTKVSTLEVVLVFSGQSWMLTQRLSIKTKSYYHRNTQLSNRQIFRNGFLDQ